MYHFYLLISNVKLTLSYISNGLPFLISKCYDNIIKLGVINTKLLGSTFNIQHLLGVKVYNVSVLC